ncbi:MAG: DNA double-strand break repair nuclease NurA [Candidatus Lokiarchaeota archaeon]|nr:DNA double-strand break repair nuclease NurA [Candidatus Lokiarchaeota archaeon]
MYIKSLHNELGEIVRRLKQLERDKEMFSMLLRGGLDQIDLDAFPKLKKDGIVERKLVKKVNPTSLTGLRIAGIDGGVVSRLYHAIDIILTKVCGVIFDFSQDKPVVRYYPADVPPLNVLVNYIPVSRTEIETSSSLERAIEEVKTAIGVLDYAKIDTLIMDGSIYPQYDIFATSTIAARGELLARFYEKLYEKARDRGTLLVGCVEDSRSTRFTQILGEILPSLIKKYPELFELLQVDYRGIIKQIKDTDLLYRVLESGERSAVYRLLSSNTKKSQSRISAQFRDTLFAFYLKSVEYDQPTRIEFLNPEHVEPPKTADRVSSVLYSLSSHHAAYGIPSVLIEADARAKIGEYELELIYAQLLNRVGQSPSLLRLRRDRRPFR